MTEESELLVTEKAVALAANKSEKRLRICLLTPYSGANLGDGAIQDAVLANIRRRHPDKEIILVTADVKNTERLHNAPSFPLTGLRIPGYSMTLARSQVDAPKENQVHRRGYSRLKSVIKSSPGIYRILRVPFGILRKVIRFLPTLMRELGHTVKTYSLLRQCEVVLVSGGGQLDEYWGGVMGHPYVLFKWAILAKMAGANLVFLSVGAGQINHWLSRTFLRIALQTALYRSYRDSVTKKTLSVFQFTRPDPIFPDVAFSYTRHTSRQPDMRPITAQDRTIGISPIAYLSPFGWPEKDEKFFQQYLNALKSFSVELLAQGHRIVLFNTDSPDRTVVDLLFSSLVSHVGESVDRVSKVTATSVDELFACLEGVEIVIASRLHGIILSHISGKPTLAISYDWKVDAYMEQVQLQEYGTNIHGIEQSSLTESFQRLCGDEARVRKRIQQHCNECRNALTQQYDNLFGLESAWTTEQDNQVRTGSVPVARAGSLPGR